MTKRNNARKRKRRKRKNRQLKNDNEKSQYDDYIPTIHEQARLWYNAQPKEGEKPRPTNMAVYIRDFFKKHEAKFVPHHIQLSDTETREFTSSKAAATYGECDLQDMARVVKKYEDTEKKKKLIIELGAGRGQLTALFFFSDMDTDVVACELSIQRFQSACTLLTLLAKEFRFFHTTISTQQPTEEKKEFIVINPHGSTLTLQRMNMFALPQKVFEDADLVMMDVHVPPEVPDRDFVCLFHYLPSRTPIITYNRNRRVWPSPPFVLSTVPELIRTDWNPDGYAFQVYHRHHPQNQVQIQDNNEACR